jgi:hypothetical protein
MGRRGRRGRRGGGGLLLFIGGVNSMRRNLEENEV